MAGWETTRTSGCCPASATASIRSPIFLGSYDFLMLGHYGDITGPHTNPNQTRAQFGNEQIQGTGLDGWFSGTNASGQICCLFHVDTTQPFYLRWHVDPSSGVNAAKVWPASAPEPKTWQRWWLIGHTWSGTNWLRIQTFDNESTADFARFYIDQIDMWGSAP